MRQRVQQNVRHAHAGYEIDREVSLVLVLKAVTKFGCTLSDCATAGPALDSFRIERKKDSSPMIFDRKPLYIQRQIGYSNLQVKVFPSGSVGASNRVKPTCVTTSRSRCASTTRSMSGGSVICRRRE